MGPRAEEANDPVPLNLQRGKETLAELVELWWADHVVTLVDNTRDSYRVVWLRHINRLSAAFASVSSRLGAWTRSGGLSKTTASARRR